MQLLALFSVLSLIFNIRCIMFSFLFTTPIRTTRNQSTLARNRSSRNTNILSSYNIRQKFQKMSLFISIRALEISLNSHSTIIIITTSKSPPEERGTPLGGFVFLLDVPAPIRLRTRQDLQVLVVQLEVPPKYCHTT